MPTCRLGCPTGFASVLLLLFAAAAPAQQMITGGIQGSGIQIPTRDRVPPPRTGTGVVRGRVVDGATGAAVARARLTMQLGMRSSILTDASGTFAFTNLPPGPVMISVEKSTYLSTRYPAPGRTIRSNNRPVPLADGQVMENVTIPIFHGASITGRVLDASGDPVDYAQVSVLRIPPAGRLGKPMMRNGSSTDDRGEFRLGRLEAGTYIVQATARRSGGGVVMMMPGAESAPPSPEPLPTYYPGVISIEQAQPITLEKGQAVTDIDVSLAEGFPGIVTGTVTTANGGVPVESNAFINVRRIVTEVTGFDGYSSGSSIRPDGTFRLTLAPGDYQLEARVSPRTMGGQTRPEDEQSGTVKITVTSGAEEAVAITVGHGAIASGRVIFEGDQAVPPSPGKARLPLFSETGQCRSGEATIEANWTFRVEGLSGTCSQPPSQMFGRWMVKAVLINGENVADSPVTFEPGQQIRNVQVIVTDKRSDMLFHVSDDTGQSTRDYVIVVYPVAKATWAAGARLFVGPPIDPPMTAMRMTSAPGPSMPVPPPRREMLSGLRPGDYYVVAVDDMEPEDYRDPLVLDRLRSSGMRVTLGEGATADVPLRRVNFADIMARR